MAFYLNKVMIGGNITADPEVREVRNNRVCNFTIAVNRIYYSHSGDTPEKREDTVFIRVTAWNKLADQLGNYIKKGANLFVEGRLTSRQWTSDEGKNINYLDVTAEKISFITNKGRDGSRDDYNDDNYSNDNSYNEKSDSNDPGENSQDDYDKYEDREDTSDLWSND